MRLHARALVALLLVFAPVCSTSFAQPLSDDALDCQQAIAGFAQRFAAAKLDALVDCNVAIVRGDACDTAARDAAIARAADRLGRALVRECDDVPLDGLGFPGVCTDANGAPFSADDLRACLLDVVEAQVDMALSVEFPAPVEQSIASVARCQVAIGREGERFLQGKLRARLRCSQLQAKGTVPQSANCRAELPPGTGDADTDALIAKLERRLEDRLQTRCSSNAPAILGFPGACADTTGDAFTVDDLVTCIRDTHEAKADAIVAAAFPSQVGPVPTTTPSPAATPSGATPVQTPSGGPSPAACVLPNPLPGKLSLIAKPGIDLDTGWTGQSHDLPGVDNGALTTVRVVDCDVNTTSPTCGQCGIEGPLQFPGSSKNCLCTNLTSRDASSLTACDPESTTSCTAPETCECYYGPPLPLSSGATPVCVVNRYTSPVTGTTNIADTGPHAGEARAEIRLESAVHNGITVDRPCPVCDNDVTPLDGVKNGTCDEGARQGGACDVSGTNIFFGNVSFDCPPRRSANIGNLDVRFNTATTETTTLGTNGVPCTAGNFVGADCFCDTCSTAKAEPCNSNADCSGGSTCGGRRCIGGANAGTPCSVTSECGAVSSCGRPGQATAPNQCDDKICSPDASNPATPNDGVCADGPFDKLCSIETFRGCLEDSDCNPPPTGSCGTCVPNQVCSGKFRDCFLDPIIRTGMAGTQMAVIAATFCLSPTSSPAVNSVAGLPGPGAVLLPTKILRAAESCGNGVLDGGELCDPPAATTCTGACDADCTCSAACGDDVVNQPTEQCDGTDPGVCTGGCQADCTCAPVCGNGVQEGDEECDMSDDSACPGVCQSDCTCGPFCGDNVVNQGTEECDGTGSTACPPSACQPDCTCGPFCGDNVIDPGEACDSTQLGTCPGTCAADCNCAPFCGNGTVEGGENCDPGGTGGALPSDSACPGACLADCRCPPFGKLSFVVVPGSDLDDGWTGQSHDAVVQAGSTIPGELGGCDGVSDVECTFFANVGSFCSGDPSRSCTASNQCLTGQTCIINTYGPPLPLSSGGVPVCVVNRFAGDVTGTYNTQTGESAIRVPLNSLVHFSPNISQPCPICDCRTCSGGANAGGVCNAASGCPGGSCAATAQGCVVGQSGFCNANPAAPCTTEATGPFGPTTNDCPPNPAANISGGGLSLAFDPATTGTASLTASLPCTAADAAGDLCWCPGEERPNACTKACDGGANDAQACASDSECPGATGGCTPLCRQIAGEAEGEGNCPAGPADQRCAGAEEIGCTSDAGCPSGTGPCETGLRRCFLDPIVRPGTPGTTTNLFGSVFCIPATTSGAINTNTGLPGPGAVRLPNQITASFCGNGSVDAGEDCDTNADANCPGACLTNCSCPANTCGNGTVEFGEQCEATSDAACPGQCAADCTCPPVCGDGFVGSGEQCDPGGVGGTPAPSDAACPGTCTNTCTCAAATCGNGTIEAGEACELPAVGCGPLQQCVACTSCS